MYIQLYICEIICEILVYIFDFWNKWTELHHLKSDCIYNMEKWDFRVLDTDKWSLVKQRNKKVVTDRNAIPAGKHKLKQRWNDILILWKQISFEISRCFNVMLRRLTDVENGLFSRRWKQVVILNFPLFFHLKMSIVEVFAIHAD